MSFTPASGTLNLGGGISMNGNIVPSKNGSYSFTATMSYAVVSGRSVVTLTFTSLNAGGTTISGDWQHRNLAACGGAHRPCG